GRRRSGRSCGARPRGQSLKGIAAATSRAPLANSLAVRGRDQGSGLPFRATSTGTMLARIARRSTLVGAAVAVAAIALPSGALAARPTCLGERATIVGNDHGNHIKGTPHGDVIVGLGGNDVIVGDGGDDVICGGPGDDQIYGRHDRDKLVGGTGSDFIKGFDANDFIVGDSVNLTGDELEPVSHDVIKGGPGNDRLVGDNYSRFNAGGGV